MRLDYADWKPARDKFLERLEGGAWRHGIKTRDAVRCVQAYGGFPSDLASMWPPKWRKKNGDAMKMQVYYYVQKGCKEARFWLVGASGERYWVRKFHNVDHGRFDGELAENGEPMPPEKEGLWLRYEDMLLPDVRQVRAGYRTRENDSSPDKRVLRETEAVLACKPDDTVVGDVLDEIIARL